MIVGVPRERKILEKRVALTPDGARELVTAGHKVLIEKDAGAGSFFPDEAYSKVGCKVVSTLEEVWGESELLIKVKEPHESEYKLLRKDMALFDYLHLASMPDVANALVKSGITSIAYELVQNADGRLPLLEPMSEVAGKLSVLNGAFYMLSQNGGRGILLGGTVGVPGAKVVILGAGIAGQSACEVAVGMGARVTVLDISYKKLEHVFHRYGSEVVTVHSSDAALERYMDRADLLIGAVLVPGASTPKLITHELMKRMKPGSVFVDISIDQGGCAESIRPTSLDEPVYEQYGVIHYGVCNMPAQTPRTSTLALTAATLPYIKQLANHGVMQTIKSSAEMRRAVNTYGGNLTNEAVGKAINMKSADIMALL